MRRRWAAHLALLVVAVGAIIGLAGSAQAADPAPDPQFSETKTLTRVFREADGTDTLVDSRDVTVRVDVTHELQARQQIHVSWTGAHPTALLANDPRGDGGSSQEYPVVILQCRGSGEEVVPETCWTSFFPQRSGNAGASQAPWVHDLYATDAERDQDGQTSWPQECLRTPDSEYYDIPFRAADGKIWPTCSTPTSAPESGGFGALPPNDLAAPTRPDGTGAIDFDVRTRSENESLGCSDTVACSLVVIPIMGVSCVDQNPFCRREGLNPPGSLSPTAPPADAVLGRMWWSESNWRGRFVVPLTFRPAPPPCAATDTRAPVDFYGSELLNEASIQWAPAYCVNPKRFTFRHNRMAEGVGFSTMESGLGAGAFVSRAQDDPDGTPVGYAPVAVTGFAIAYALDKPDATGPITDLRLTPRLLAKLLTQSYTSILQSSFAHPGMESNPYSMSLDPEFRALNPAAREGKVEAMATLLALSTSSDVMYALTGYIAADPDARAFLAGTPDPYGMVVNPSYKGVQVPTADWPLLDTFVPPWTDDCRIQNMTTPYLSLVAAPVSSLSSIATSVLAGQPNSQTACEADSSAHAAARKGPPQGWGGRNMLGLVSLGDAERFGLSTAALLTSGSGAGATFVAPSETAMAAAVGTATQPAPGAPFVLDAAKLRTVPAAYPGTMIVYSASRLTGMDPRNAAAAATFVTVATSEGQQPGADVGDLPPGYLPITAGGPTAPLLASATQVAAAVAAQSGAVGTTTPAPPEPVPGLATTGGATTTSAPDGAAAPMADDAAPETETVTGSPADATPPATASGPPPSTEADDAGTAATSVPIAMGAALGALVAAPLLRRIPAKRVR